MFGWPINTWKENKLWPGNKIGKAQSTAHVLMQELSFALCLAILMPSFLWA